MNYFIKKVANILCVDKIKPAEETRVTRVCTVLPKKCTDVSVFLWNHGNGERSDRSFALPARLRGCLRGGRKIPALRKILEGGSP